MLNYALRNETRLHRRLISISNRKIAWLQTPHTLDDRLTFLASLTHSDGEHRYQIHQNTYSYGTCCHKHQRLAHST
jgi:hypothetical protein